MSESASLSPYRVQKLLVHVRTPSVLASVRDVYICIIIRFHFRYVPELQNLVCVSVCLYTTILALQAMRAIPTALVLQRPFSGFTILLSYGFWAILVTWYVVGSKETPQVQRI